MMKNFDISNIESLKNVIHSLPYGMYITDMNRKILFWNKKAEEITGWKAEEVIEKNVHMVFYVI